MSWTSVCTVREGPSDAPDDHVPHGTDDDTEPDVTEEVEVLGIRLTRENERSGSGPLTAGVTALGALAVLAVLGGALSGRDS